MPSSETHTDERADNASRLGQILEGRAGRLCLVPKSAFDRLLEVDTPSELRAQLFATYCRLNILYMVARAGSGHPGTCLSSIDLMSWLYLNEIRGLDENPDSADVFFSSKGHDAPAFYTVLIALGLLDFETLHQLRRLGGLPGHPHIETPHVYAGTGSLGMGISKAKGMIAANRLLGNDRHVYVMTGDGELQEGQIWESLSTAARENMGELTAIVDHNKIQSDTWVSDVSDLGDVGAKFAAFGWEVARCDGHEVAAIGEIMRRFRTITDRPKVLVADTIKGKGVSFMEGPKALEDGGLYDFHSGAPSVEQYDAAIREVLDRALTLHSEAGLAELDVEWLERDPHVKHTGFGNIHRLMAAYEDELVKQAETNDKIV
ncbi:MAG TPA: transketolase, partial [Acidobacteriota bacterium]|nr:transketolase [Acidobacteriota bacterium]